MNYFNYFSEIEAAFIRRRGRNLLLSPVDWTLIESWQKSDIPLHLILQSIEDVFDARDKKPTKRAVKSLSYCKDEVEARYAEWLAAQVGKSSGTDDSTENASEGEIREHLLKVLAEFRSTTSKLSGKKDKSFEAIAKKLEDLIESGKAGEELELKLEELDEEVDGKLKAIAADDATMRDLEISMAEYKRKMDEASYQKTFDLMLTKKLREKTEVPRFSLFNL